MRDLKIASGLKQCNQIHSASHSAALLTEFGTGCNLVRGSAEYRVVHLPHCTTGGRGIMGRGHANQFFFPWQERVEHFWILLQLKVRATFCWLKFTPVYLFTNSMLSAFSKIYYFSGFCSLFGFQTASHHG